MRDDSIPAYRFDSLFFFFFLCIWHTYQCVLVLEPRLIPSDLEVKTIFPLSICLDTFSLSLSLTLIPILVVRYPNESIISLSNEFKCAYSRGISRPPQESFCLFFFSTIFQFGFVERKKLLQLRVGSKHLTHIYMYMEIKMQRTFQRNITRLSDCTQPLPLPLPLSSPSLCLTGG